MSSNNKRYAAMNKIGTELGEACYATAWSLVAAEVKKGVITRLLQTGFRLKPSVEEVLGIYDELSNEFTRVWYALKNHGSANRTSDGKFKPNYAESESNLCFVNFLRDLMEIPDLAMIKMRRVLAECNCCRRHMMRRPCCQQKTYNPDYPDIYGEVEHKCKCACRSFSRHLERALTDQMPLEVKGQLWERSA
jgi:hypothetical protein